MSSKAVPTLAFILIAASIFFVISNSAGGSGTKQTVNDGVFTAKQANRGAQIYARHCVECHGANMRGGPGSPGVAGLEFKFLWNGRTVGELYEAARTKMPPGKAGTLSDQEYIDVVAAILQGNGFLPGEDADLPAIRGTLDVIRITWDE